MKIKTNYVPDTSKGYLTEGKVYEVILHGRARVTGWVVDDEDERITVYLKEGGCCHLEGRSWEILE